jgi:recombinase
LTVDTGKRQRVARPRSEWITHTDESLRIVTDELFSRAQRRLRPAHDPRPEEFRLERQCADCGSWTLVTVTGPYRELMVEQCAAPTVSP